MDENRNDIFITKQISEVLDKTIDFLNKEKNDKLENNIQSFVTSRIFDIKNDETPVPLDPSGKLIIYLIPFNSFNPIEQEIKLSLVKENNYLLNPLGADYYDNRYNYDGYLTYNDFGYTQIFRNGCIEAVSNYFYNYDNKKINALNFELSTIKNLPKYIKLLKVQKVEGPFYIFITFTKTKEYSLLRSSNHFIFGSEVIDKNEIALPRVRIENSDNIESFMKHSFDVLWNAGGIPESPNYKNGLWTL